MGKGKHKGNNNIMSDKRNFELYRKFRDTIKSILCSRGYVSTVEAVDIARNSPCSCYFVGYDRAYSILKRIDNHNNWHHSKEHPVRPMNPLRHMRDTTRSMFLDLYHEYEKVRKENPNESPIDSVIRACDSPASRFYITYDTARKVITDMARKANEKI